MRLGKFFERTWLAGAFILLAAAGCVTDGSKTGGISKAPVIRTDGIYHTVEKGQTLWSIARRYSIELDTLLEANGIQDSGKVETGQLIFVPGRRQAPDTMISQDEDFIWPLRGTIIADFGAWYAGGNAKGMTIQSADPADVIAARSGTVSFCADSFLDLGKTVIIEHPGGFWTVYGRAAEVLVKPGDPVRRGQPVARTGAAAGKYLYFEIRKAHVPKNPRFYLP